MIVNKDTVMQTDKHPELDERVWQAWLAKNAAQDKVRFSRRVRVIGFAAVALALIGLLWSLTQAYSSTGSPVF
jgi:hypothetical protein